MIRPRSIVFVTLTATLLATGAVACDVPPDGASPGWEQTSAPLEVNFTPVPLYRDSDNDCLSDAQEILKGTDPLNPDTDGDGWFDGPCNERRRLVVEMIIAHDEQEDVGDDEIYLMVDDVRFPNAGGLDDWWNIDDGDVLSLNLAVAERTRGTNQEGALASVSLELWEDDYEAVQSWSVDDLLVSTSVDLAQFSSGQRFTRRYTYDGWDYEIRFRVDVVKFADPSPRDANADADGDGISDAAEFDVARDFGGITDPARQDILVEVDWMNGHTLKTAAKRQVVTQFHRHKYHLVILRHEQVPTDLCLTRTEAVALYHQSFTHASYGAFRYAVMSGPLWTGQAGEGIGDALFVDDTTWWIDGEVLAQAGTFMNQLGNTLGLVKARYAGIDAVGHPTYDSAMNYLYQATLVNYSDDGLGGLTGDHDDWADVDAAYGLLRPFSATTQPDDGVCQ